MTPEVASLLLRQHSALMEEGIDPGGKQPGDKEILEAAWLLACSDFGLHWGYEYGFEDSDEHSRNCDCTAGKVYRGELKWCHGCQRHVALEHECRAHQSVAWLTELQGRGD